jgi:hypothetical protein
VKRGPSGKEMGREMTSVKENPRHPFNPENLKDRLTSEYREGRTPKHFYNQIMNRLDEVQYEF